MKKNQEWKERRVGNRSNIKRNRRARGGGGRGGGGGGGKRGGGAERYREVIVGPEG